MRILLLGWGSRGDVEPFIALGLRLHQAGHEVAIAAGRDYAPWIRSYGLACEPFAIDMQEGMRSPVGRAWLGGAGGDTRAELRAMSEVVDTFAEVVVDGLLGMVRPDDLVVSSTMTFDSMLSLADVRGCDHVCALFVPGVPTRSGAASLAPARAEADSWLNVAAGYVAVGVTRQAMAAPGRLMRARLGLRRETLWGAARSALRVPVLLATSPVVVPQASDWGPRVRVTGYWTLPTAVPGADELAAQGVPGAHAAGARAAGSPAARTDRVERAPSPVTGSGRAQVGAALSAEVPQAVRDFLAAGAPPVYLGFGSMTSPDPRATAQLLFDGVRRSGLRAVVHRGVDELGGAGVPSDLVGQILLVDSVPHAWLLPRCAGVVTHGGAGSAGAGLRSGVPSMAIPHIGDQPYWGRRLHELGVGPAPIGRGELTGEKLAAALRTLVSDAGMARRAAQLATALAREDGAGQATELLGNRLARRR